MKSAKKEQPEQGLKKLSKTLAKHLETARRKVGGVLTDRFTDYANKTLWDESKPHSTYQVQPIQAADLKSVQLSKHILLAMDDANKLLIMSQEFLDRSTLGKAYHLKSDYNKAMDIYQQSLSAHLNGITELLREVEIPEDIRKQYVDIQEKLKGVTSTLSVIFPGVKIFQAGIEADPTQYEAKNDETFFDLASSVVNVRPAAPKLPGQERSEPAERREYKDVLPLGEDLAGPLAAGVEAAGFAMPLATEIVAKFDAEIKQKKQAGLVLNKRDELYVDATLNALKADGAISIEGFFEKSAKETEVSQLLKSAFNALFRAKTFLEKNPDPGILLLKLGKDLYPDVKELMRVKRKLTILKLNKQVGTLLETPIQMVLVEARNQLVPELERFAESVHNIERENGLRYGALLQEARPFFDEIEKMFLESGVIFANPLGNVKETKNTKELQDRLKQESVEAFKEKSANDFLLRHLKEYPNSTIPSASLLIELVKLKSKFNLNDAEKKAYDSIENRLITDLEGKEAKVILASELNKISHPNDDVQDLMEKLKGKPIKQSFSRSSFKKLVNVLERRDKILTGAFEQKKQQIVMLEQGPKEEARERENLRTEFTARMLRKEGLNSILGAIRSASDARFERDNLPQKRLLAVFLADSQNKPRLDFLEQAHQKAVSFLNDPAQIKDFVMKIHNGALGEKNKSIARALAIELTLTGVAKIKDWGSTKELIPFLGTHDPKLVKQDLLNILTRLESKQVYSLFEKGASGNDLDAFQRLKLFNSLVTTNSLLPLQVGSLLSSKPPLNQTMDAWVKQFVDRYNNETDPEVKNKIGLFLGRLALEDVSPDRAFAHSIYKQASPIVRAECLKNKKTSVIYFESLMNFLDLNAAYENKTFEQYLNQNKDFIAALHLAILPDEKRSKEELLSAYQKNPLGLVNLLMKIEREHLSLDSAAQVKIKEFYSGLVLTQGNEAKLLRERLFNSLDRTGGIKRAPYVSLLTDEHELVVWKQVSLDLVADAKANFNVELAKVSADVKQSMASLSEARRSEFTAKLQGIVAKQIKKLDETLADLAAAKKPMSEQCRYINQEIKLAQGKGATEASKLVENLMGNIGKVAAQEAEEAKWTNASATFIASVNASTQAKGAALQQAVGAFLPEQKVYFDKKLPELIAKQNKVMAEVLDYKIVPNNSAEFRRMQARVIEAQEKNAERMAEMSKDILDQYVKNIIKEYEVDRKEIKHHVDKKFAKEISLMGERFANDLTRAAKTTPLHDFRDAQKAMMQLSDYKNAQISAMKVKYNYVRQEAPAEVKKKKPFFAEMSSLFGKKEGRKAAANDPHPPSVPRPKQR